MNSKHIKASNTNGGKKITFKRYLAAIIAIALTFCLVMALTACAKDDAAPDGNETPSANTVAELTNEQFSASASKFLNELVLVKAISAATGSYDAAQAVSYSYDLGDGSATSLNCVKVIYVYKDGAERIFNAVKVNFASGIALNLISNYDANKDALQQAVNGATVTDEFASRYNVADKAEYDELAEAVYANIVKAPDVAEILVLKVNEIKDYPLKGFVSPCMFIELTAKTATAIKTYDVILCDGEDSDLIDFTQNANFYELSASHDKVALQTPFAGKAYVKETYQPEGPSQGESADNMQGLFANYGTQAKAFFASQTEAAIAKVIGDYNACDVKAVRWSAGDNELTELTSAILEFTVADPAEEGKETFYRVTVSYRDAVSLETVAEGDAETIGEIVANISCEQQVKLEYNGLMQYFRSDIVEALTEVSGYALTESDRIMVSFGEGENGYITYVLGITNDSGYTQYTVTAIDGATSNISIGTVSSDAYGNSDNVIVETAYRDSEYVITDVEFALTNFADLIDENLANVYMRVMFQALGNSFMEEMNNVTEYKWDFGTPDSDGKIQSLKLAFTYSNNGGAYYVYNINFINAITVNDLLTKTFTKDDFNSSRAYIYQYSLTSQGDLDAFIDATAEAVLDDGFDYNAPGTLKLYRCSYAGVLDFNYFIAIINDSGVREISVQLSNKLTTAEELAAAIESGDYILFEQNSVDFSDNQIDFQRDGELKALLAKYSDLIDENLANVYKRIMFQALGNSFMDEMNNVTEYKWDFGTPDSDGKIQSLKLAFMHAGSAVQRRYYVYNINFTPAVTVNDLLTKTFTKDDFNSSRAYIYQYSLTSQGDLDAFIDATAEAVLEYEFNYNAPGTLKLYKVISGGINENDYTISIINDTGVREIKVQVSNKLSTAEELAAAIKKRDYELLSQKAVDFSDIQLNYVRD